MVYIFLDIAVKIYNVKILNVRPYIDQGAGISTTGTGTLAVAFYTD